MTPSILPRNDEIPAEEFRDFHSTLNIFSDSGDFKSLDDALLEKFDIKEYSNIEQRHKFVAEQSYKVSDLWPTPLYLLTKRQKKCRTCMKILVKQPNNLASTSQSDRMAFLLRDIVPKITIYRFSKYQEGQPMEVQLKFLNLNDSLSNITLKPLAQSDVLLHIVSIV